MKETFYFQRRENETYALWKEYGRKEREELRMEFFLLLFFYLEARGVTQRTAVTT